MSLGCLKTCSIVTPISARDSRRIFACSRYKFRSNPAPEVCTVAGMRTGVCLDTYRALLKYGHVLAAHCTTCNYRGNVNLVGVTQHLTHSFWNQMVGACVNSGSEENPRGGSKSFRPAEPRLGAHESCGQPSRPRCGADSQDRDGLRRGPARNG